MYCSGIGKEHSPIFTLRWRSSKADACAINTWPVLRKLTRPWKALKHSHNASGDWLGIISLRNRVLTTVELCVRKLDENLWSNFVPQILCSVLLLCCYTHCDTEQMLHFCCWRLFISMCCRWGDTGCLANMFPLSHLNVKTNACTTLGKLEELRTLI